MHQKRASNKTVNAVIYHASDDTRVEQQSLSAIQDSELLVRVDGCGSVPLALEAMYQQKLSITSTYSSARSAKILLHNRRRIELHGKQQL
jgi:hypothetical protein